jgi:hypothetical protein
VAPAYGFPGPVDWGVRLLVMSQLRVGHVNHVNHVNHVICVILVCAESSPSTVV